MRLYYCLDYNSTNSLGYSSTSNHLY